MIWIHDYHLIPLGAGTEGNSGSGTASASSSTFPFLGLRNSGRCRVHRALGQYLRAYDLVGFQTCMDRAKYLSYQRDEYHSTSHQEDVAGVFPIGIATRSFEALASTALISSEPLKGIFQRFTAECADDHRRRSARLHQRPARAPFMRRTPGCFRVHLNSPRPRASFQVAPVGRQDVPA